MIQVNGTKFYNGSEEILFKGIGIGSWLNLEHFMIGVPGCDFQIRQTIQDVFGKETERAFYDRFVRAFMSEKDFRFLKDQGINLIRVPFNYRLFIDDRAPDKLKEEGFLYFDYLMDLCEKYEIYVLPDLHAVPGGQNPDWHSDNGTGYTLFWQYGVFQEQVIQLWRAIAARYRDREYLLGYDLLNEPFLIPDFLDTSGEKDPATGVTAAGSAEYLADFYKRVTDAIRSVDQRHIIFLEGDHFASDFRCLHGRISDAQTALTFHFYPTVWYEDLFEADYDPIMRQKKFREIFEGLIQIRDSFNRPVLCGEAGYDIVNNGYELCMKLVDLTMTLFSEYKVSFTLWCYKDAGFMGMVYPEPDSSWMKFAAKIRTKWNHYQEMEFAEAGMRGLFEQAYPDVTEAERYLLAFRQRAVLYPVEQKYVLKPMLAELGAERFLTLPDSFSFERCEYYRSYAEKFRKFSF